MTVASETIQALGFFVILACLSTLLIRLTQAFIKGKRAQLRYGIEALLILGIVYYLIEHGLSWIGFELYSDDMRKGVAFLWWLHLAFVIDKSLSLYAWQGVLSYDGQRQVPRIVTGGTSLFLYTSAIVIVLHYFYDKPIGTLLATSGAVALEPRQLPQRLGHRGPHPGRRDAALHRRRRGHR